MLFKKIKTFKLFSEVVKETFDGIMKSCILPFLKITLRKILTWKSCNFTCFRTLSEILSSWYQHVFGEKLKISIYLCRGSFLGDMFSKKRCLYIFWSFNQNLLIFWQEIVGKVVNSSFYDSRGTLWEKIPFLKKLEVFVSFWALSKNVPQF